MRLSPEIRGTFRRLVKKELTVTGIAYLFDTTRQTVHRWLRRGKHVGKNGADNTASNHTLLIYPIPKTKAKWRDAYKTSTESSSTTPGNSLDG